MIQKLLSLIAEKSIVFYCYYQWKIEVVEK